MNKGKYCINCCFCFVLWFFCLYGCCIHDYWQICYITELIRDNWLQLSAGFVVQNMTVCEPLI